MDEYAEQRSRYEQRLNALYLDIEQWLIGSGVVFDSQPTVIDEGVGQQYSLSALVIRAESGELVATVKPEGWNIIGAEGMVRIIGPYDRRIVSYFTDNGPGLNAQRSVNGVVGEPIPRYLFSGIDEPGWYVITDPKTGATRRLDADLLKEILAGVSDYAG